MKARQTLTVLALLLASVPSARAAVDGIAPAKLEINLGPVPIDLYKSTTDMAQVVWNRTSVNGPTIIPNCPTCWSIRACIRGMFNNVSTTDPYNPFLKPNYIGQGVTGVRFLYDLGGGAYSTPFDASGNVRTEWLNRLRDFFEDLHSWGIVRVTPTPVVHAPFFPVSACTGPGNSFPCWTASVTSCSNPKTLVFYKWLPFGLDPETGAPDRVPADNTSYNCANENPGFQAWGGWQPLFNLIAAVNSIAAEKQLTIADYDIDNELDLFNFTVLGRLIYDNKHGPDGRTVDQFGNPLQTDVLGTIRTLLPNSKVTYSTPIFRPTQAIPSCCASTYGDCAMILPESALTGALQNTGFGSQGGTQTNNLQCAPGDSGLTLASLGVSYAEPPVTNIHSHVCVEEDAGNNASTGKCCGLVTQTCPNPDATSTATALYNGVYSFLQRVPARLNNYVVFGETNHTNALAAVNPQGDPVCPAQTRTANAAQNVNGLLASSLFINDKANLVLRVWNNQIDEPGCYVRPNIPSTVNPPYDPNHP